MSAKRLRPRGAGSLPSAVWRPGNRAVTYTRAAGISEPIRAARASYQTGRKWRIRRRQPGLGHLPFHRATDRRDLLFRALAGSRDQTHRLDQLAASSGRRLFFAALIQTTAIFDQPACAGAEEIRRADRVIGPRNRLGLIEQIREGKTMVL